MDKIKLSVRADPGKLKAYLERLIECWPQSPASSFAAPESAPGNGSGTTDIAAQGRAAVSLLDRASASGATRQFFSNAERLLGGLPNGMRAWGHIPHAAKYFPAFSFAIERTGGGGRVPADLKALVRVRIAHVNAARYSLAHAVGYARAAGVSERRIELLQSGNLTADGEFTIREHAALAWAEEVSWNTAKHRDDLFAELKRHFDDAEIVELTGLCAETNMVNRIYNALRIPPDTESQIAAMNRSPHVDSSRIKAYLQTILAEWPERLPD